MDLTKWAEAASGSRLLPEGTVCDVVVVAVTEKYKGDPYSIRVILRILDHPGMREFPMWLRIPQERSDGTKSNKYYIEARKLMEFVDGFKLDKSKDFNPQHFKGRRATVILGFHTTRDGVVIHRIYRFKGAGSC